MHGREKPQPLRGEYTDALGVTSLKFHNLKGPEAVWPHHLVASAWAEPSKFLAPTSIEIPNFQFTNRIRAQEASHFERSSGIRCIGLKQVGSLSRARFWPVFTRVLSAICHQKPVLQRARKPPNIRNCPLGVNNCNAKLYHDQRVLSGTDNSLCPNARGHAGLRARPLSPAANAERTGTSGPLVCW